MIDDAIELSVQEGDSTLVGAVAEWLDSLGKFNGTLSVAKGLVAVHVLRTGLLTLSKDGKGNFIIKASQTWLKGANKKYESKLAEIIYQLLEKGDKNSSNIIKRALAKYNRAPSGVLRELIGLHAKTNKISFGKIVEQYHKILAFDKNLLKEYKVQIDVSKTATQFKIPYIAVFFSVITNSGEFFSDTNQNKSMFEKTGRFVAGLGLDAGVTALTSTGALIGSMVAPGVGTFIGGAIGATVGFVGSLFVEDTVKDWGETAGRWVEERVEDIEEFWDSANKAISNSFSNTKKFIVDFFN
jgi:hypothetical protein